MYEALTLLNQKLSTITTVNSCKIGLEDDIAPADYPIIRIVAGRSTGLEAMQEKHEVKIYFGFDLNEFDGLDVIYEKLYVLEKEIKDLIVPDMNPYLCRWISTISDEDRLQGFKILCMIVEMEL